MNQSDENQITGQLILILGPSGTGKGTVIAHLKKTFPELVFPASYTTRDTRPGEKAGEVYHFITQEKFKQKIDRGDFLEYAIVHGDNYYGTDKNEILKNLRKGKTVLREVDIQGVNSLKQIIPLEHIHTIFITTDSWQKLEKRIKKRANISQEELLKREKSYHKEIESLNEMDHILYSEEGKIDECNQEAEKLIQQIVNQSSQNQAISEPNN